MEKMAGGIDRDDLSDAVFTRDTFTWGKLTFLFYTIVLHCIFYCEMTFISCKRVLCKHGIRLLILATPF